MGRGRSFFSSFEVNLLQNRFFWLFFTKQFLKCCLIARQEYTFPTKLYKYL